MSGSPQNVQIRRGWLLFVSLIALTVSSCTDGDTDSQTSPPPNARDSAPTTITPPTTTTAPTTTAPPTTLPTVQLTTSTGFGQVLVEGAPPGASVVLFDQAGEPAASVEIDDDGMGFARDLSPGSYDPVIEDGGSPIATAAPIDLPAQTPPDPSFYDDQRLSPGYGYLEVRDGTTLSVFVTLPGPPADGPYPTLVEYSGYDPSNPGLDDPSRLLIPTLGYALVQVNVRGTGCSGGSFDAFEPIQDLDGYDVIETVAAQSWSAKVGMWGISYPAIMQLHVAATQPPNLAAIAPLSPLDRIESVLFPGGVFNDGFGEEWTVRVGRRAEAFGQSWTRTRSDAGDTVCAENQELRRFNPDIVALLAENSDRTDLWESRSAEPTAADIDVPVFIAGAWQDEQTGGRFPALLDDLKDAPELRAVLYNGLHSDPLGPDVLPRVLEFYDFYVGERRPGVDLFTRLATEFALGEIFGGPVRLEGNRFDGQSYAAALDAYEAEPGIRVLFEVGANRPNLPQASWAADFDRWPIADVAPDRWFFDAGGSLRTDAPFVAASASFEADPAEGQRITAPDLDALWTNRPGWEWTATEESNRLVHISAPMTETLTMVGSASVDLWVASDQPDVALEATITEVAPDGTETLVQTGWLDLSRRALDDASTELRPVPTLTADDRSPLAPGERVLARIEILPFAHVFRPGSQIRVTIDAPGGNSARWRFRNDFAAATVEVFSGGEAPSSIVLPVVDGLVPPVERPPCGSLRGQPCRPLP